MREQCRQREGKERNESEIQDDEVKQDSVPFIMIPLRSPPHPLKKELSHRFGGTGLHDGIAVDRIFDCSEMTRMNSLQEGLIVAAARILSITGCSRERILPKCQVCSVAENGSVVGDQPCGRSNETQEFNFTESSQEGGRARLENGACNKGCVVVEVPNHGTQPILRNGAVSISGKNNLPRGVLNSFGNGLRFPAGGPLFLDQDR